MPWGNLTNLDRMLDILAASWGPRLIVKRPEISAAQFFVFEPALKACHVIHLGVPPKTRRKGHEEEGLALLMALKSFWNLLMLDHLAFRCHCLQGQQGLDKLSNSSRSAGGGTSIATSSRHTGNVNAMHEKQEAVFWNRLSSLLRISAAYLCRWVAILCCLQLICTRPNEFLLSFAGNSSPSPTWQSFFVKDFTGSRPSRSRIHW